MRRYAKNRKNKLNIMILTLLSLIFFLPGSNSKALNNDLISGNRQLVITKTPEKKTDQCFSLVEARIIDLKALDDQELESLTPSLIAPKRVALTNSEYHQKALQEYNHSVCFKQCHTRNDFSVSDYTYKQWCQLIEKDGHSVFSEIPWDNPGKKEKLMKYLANNAKNPSSKPEGIGSWH